jgi:hypothetical protein
MKIFRNFSVLVVFLSSLPVTAQKDKIYLSGEAMNFVFFNAETEKIVSTVPRGKNVELIYDSFFKSWTIRYDDENGIRQATKWTYLQDLQEGEVMVQGVGGTNHKMMNLIESQGRLVILFDKPLENGLTGWIEYTGIKIKPASK